MENSVFGRVMAFAIAVIAGTALVLRVQLSMPDHGGDAGLAMWEMMRFFTVLTNAMVALILLFHLLDGAQSASRLAGMTLSICIVGVVYHLLLAHLTDLSGLELAVDHAFHTVVPLLTFLWWASFAPKAGLGVLAPLRWLLWPAGYSVYAIARGLYLDGQYPYPFLNLAELGWQGLAESLASFLIAFAIAGYVLWGVAKLLARQSRPG